MGEPREWSVCALFSSVALVTVMKQPPGLRCDVPIPLPTMHMNYLWHNERYGQKKAFAITSITTGTTTYYCLSIFSSISVVQATQKAEDRTKITEDLVKEREMIISSLEAELTSYKNEVEHMGINLPSSLLLLFPTAKF